MKGTRRGWKAGAWLTGACLSVVAAGCVLPGEFDAVDNTCDMPSFDVETRDAYCSGSLDSRVVHQEVGFNTTDKPLIQVQGRFISIINQDARSGSLLVRVLERGRDGRFSQVLERDFFGGPGQPLTSFALMGLNRPSPSLDDATLALVYGQRRLRFVPLNESQSVDEFDDAPVLTGDALAAFDTTDCPIDPGSGELPLVDVASLSSRAFAEHDYLMVAARCAMVVYGRVGRGEPQLLTQFPIKAQDIEVDGASDRMFVAAGLDGLQVRSLRPFEERLDLILAPEEGASSNDGGNNDGVDDPGQPDRDDELAFTPELGDESSFVLSDPSIQALTNVVQVAYTSQKVFFINAPTATGRDEDEFTYLVSGELNDDGLLVSRRSVPIARDGAEDQIPIEWHIAGLGDSLVAILGNRSEEIEGTGQVGVNSQLKLYDAPLDKTPEFIIDIPIGGAINAIQVRDGELWTFQNDQISAYDIKVSGEPLD